MAERVTDECPHCAQLRKIIEAKNRGLDAALMLETAIPIARTRTRATRWKCEMASAMIVEAMEAVRRARVAGQWLEDTYPKAVWLPGGAPPPPV